MGFEQINAIAASGMAAQRLRVQLIAGNIANSETTRTPEGGPFRRRDAVFQVAPLGQTSDGMPLAGVQVSRIVASSEPFITKFDPNHPDANAEGIVQYPNIDPTQEMVNLTEATRAFDANVSVLRASRNMVLSAQELLRVQ